MEQIVHGSKWECLEIENGMSVADLRSRLERFPENAFIAVANPTPLFQFLSPVNDAESRSRIRFPVCVSHGVEVT